jgi:hypothetical protein
MEGGGLHLERPGGGGESGVCRSSTELLPSSRLKTTEGVSWLDCGARCWAGLDFGQMGCGQVSGLPLFSASFLYFLFSVLLLLIQVCYFILQVLN